MPKHHRGYDFACKSTTLYEFFSDSLVIKVIKTSVTSHFVIPVPLSNNYLSHFVFPATLCNNFLPYFVKVVLKFAKRSIFVILCNTFFEKDPKRVFYKK